jgi:hypothetical protein
VIRDDDNKLRIFLCNEGSYVSCFKVCLLTFSEIGKVGLRAGWLRW